MRLLPIFAIMFSAVLLQGCIGAAVVGTAAVATKSATDPRSVGQQVDDGTLEARVSGQLNKNKDITNNSRIIATAYKGNVLLTGQSPDMSLADKAKQIASNVDGTEKVYNEVRQGQPVDLGTASKDTWLTTKVKSKILASDEVKSGSVKVITENGEVFLLGVLTQQEGAAAAKIASETDGVRRVTTAFTYLN
ncbi:TPA: division/outer membrane stress-associated lipid-binding lipoprotein [Providencia alcalifaciens]|uniref:Divisome-associated lipoprotein YraP n=3 Tax=Providencia alcalifaciens TaxID=126385 RepID=A0AAW9VBW9_9GAMM|nr:MULTISPECIES: division/outer membrane stress-associated lipid-binding lipoprotein [Providencia]EKT64117.1 outer membrane lipoprotein [Providencia alcalifaciens Dmel2]ATG16181.1 osmotically-inducible protein OsmY [Providencia alcalifaciens]EEB45804.1 phospholipid-binding domain protein [Providencia alcalifaciens DSM 30120]ETT04258.1 BON domain protein [Providencia alcalifaciens F90-2004]EUC95855.1 BON domain protein [Providencia alcalifaciens PAL-2]